MNTKSLGLTLMIAGMAGALYFFIAFNTSIEVPKSEVLGQAIGGNRINNIGLMNDRQNGLILSGIIAIVGAILFVAPQQRREPSGSVVHVRGGKVCPACRLISPETASRCDCGQAL